MAKLYENAGQAEGALKADVEMAEAFREELLREKASSCYGEKGLFLERTDQLSHFYLGALEELGKDLLIVKLILQDRLGVRKSIDGRIP